MPLLEIHKKLSIIASLLLGVLLLLIGSYSLVGEIVFVQSAVGHTATIVEVRHELVQKGKGSVLAYVPVVEIPAADNSPRIIRVDTYSEEPVYNIGKQLKILCDSSSARCVQNTFLDKWGDSLVLLLLSLVFLAMAALYYWRNVAP